VGLGWSQWSAVGLTISLAIGFDNFDELLVVQKMDDHFKTADFDQNMPVLLY
jgi:glucose-6-phosphate isomerase